MRTYYDALKTGKVVNVSDFIPTYRAMMPSLHHRLSEPWLDVATLNYALTRFPQELRDTSQVVMVKDEKQLQLILPNSHVWKKVKAQNRRRLCFYNSISRTLVLVITSDSDIDDIVNALVAIEIETKKINECLKKQRKQYDETELINLFGINAEEFSILKGLMGDDWRMGLSSWGIHPGMSVQLTNSDVDYSWGFKVWVDQLQRESLYFDLFNTPVYFVSSNTHSLTNLISGYVWQIESRVFNYIEGNYPQLYQQWLNIKLNNDPTRVYDLVYYLSKIYLDNHPDEIRIRDQMESEKGIRRIVSTGPFDTSTQIIPLNAIPNFAYPDPLLNNLPLDVLKKSNAIIINIEYPLGQAAFYLLKTFFNTFRQVKGVYIIGKAAILNGNIGDIQIPRVVLDEKTASTFSFDNCFNHFPVSTPGVKTHESQKALSLHGTYLENRRQMENYLARGYNVIEMESGSYLAAMYQFLHPDQSVFDGNYDINQTPFEIGIINYASDNPLVQTLGDTPLITRGIEPTYAATSAVIRRIVDLETKA